MKKLHSGPAVKLEEADQRSRSAERARQVRGAHPLFLGGARADAGAEGNRAVSAWGCGVRPSDTGHARERSGWIDGF